MIGLVLEPVKSASLDGLHNLLVLACRRNCLLFRLSRIFFLVFFFLIFLDSLCRNPVVCRTWDSNTLRFQRFLDFGQLLDECGELLDVEGDSLRLVLAFIARSDRVMKTSTYLPARKHLLIFLVELAKVYQLLALELVDLHAASASELSISSVVTCRQTLLMYIPPSTGSLKLLSYPWPLSRAPLSSSCSLGHPRRSRRRLRNRRRRRVCEILWVALLMNV
jgi:hypothetical protein